MFAYIKGILTHTTSSYAIVEVQSIGYTIFVPKSDLALLPPCGKNVVLHTLLYIKENSLILFGFLETGSKTLFEKLISVSGIGPKMALALLGNMGAAALVAALQRQDIQTLIQTPGVGKKIAQRLVLEMKDKVMDFSLPFANNALFQDAHQALIHLGYSPTLAMQAIEKTIEGHKDLELEKLITLSLQNING